VVNRHCYFVCLVHRPRLCATPETVIVKFGDPEENKAVNESLCVL